MNLPILVTLDENYIPQLRVLETSLYMNNGSITNFVGFRIPLVALSTHIE